MGRAFGKISSTLWASKKFREIVSSSGKLAYVYLHSNNHGNANGCFRMPAAYLASDLGIGLREAEDVLIELEAVDLIELDQSEEYVRLKGWWRFNSITNRKHLTANIKACLDMPQGRAMTCQICFEICEKSLFQFRKMTTDKKGTEAYTSATEMLRQMVLKVFEADVDGALFREGNEVSKGLWIELSKELSIDHSSLSFPDTDSDSDTDTDSDKRQETETERVRKNAQEAPIDATIEALRKKRDQEKPK